MELDLASHYEKVRFDQAREENLHRPHSKDSPDLQQLPEVGFQDVVESGFLL
jgi:hypothetical protein